MKLMFIAIEFPPGPGGMGTLAYQIVRRLTDLGWESVVITSQNYADSAEIEAFNANQPFTIKRFRYVGNILFESVDRLRLAWQTARQHKPDVIMAANEKSVWLGALLAMLTRTAFVPLGCGTEFLRGGKLYQAITRWAYNRATHTVSISNYTLGLIKAMQIDTNNVSVIPCGADFEAYGEPVTHNPLSQTVNPDSRPLLLTVGQLSPRKGQEVVIRALPTIKAAIPNVLYVMAGLPTAQSQLSSLAAELNVSENVCFLGRVSQDDLRHLYALADLFVLVSRRTAKGDVEGYGIVVNEAGLQGVAAVVSAESGLAEAIVPDKTGICVAPNDPSATADAIIRLLGDDRLRQKMGDAAQQHAIENATWQKRVAAYDELLRQVVRRPS